LEGRSAVPRAASSTRPGTKLFGAKSKAAPTKADTIAKLRTETEAARASQTGVDAREVASILGQNGDHRRQRDAVTRPVL
jgi:hypothetical protein